MDAKLLESIKGKSREERVAFFNAHKDELCLNDLSAVSGGDNENSSCPYHGVYYTSLGYVCGISHC